MAKFVATVFNNHVMMQNTGPYDVQHVQACMILGKKCQYPLVLEALRKHALRLYDTMLVAM